MNNPSEKQLNDHLRRAVSAIPSNHAEELWNTPVEKANSDAWFLEGTESKKKKTCSYLRWASLAAACFVIIFFGWFQVSRVPDASVYLDVNPSVTLNVNRLGKVIGIKAENEDGLIILDNMNLQNTDVDVAMNALLGSMVKHGYLSQTQNTLLLSVNGKNEARTTALRQKLSLSAEQTLETLLGSGIVLGQTVDLDGAAQDIAEHYGITPGKAALIIRLLKDQSPWNLQDLAAMPMSDLIRCCQAAGIDISQYLGENGEVIGDLSSLLDDDDEHDGKDDIDDHDDNDDFDDVDDHDDRDDDDHDDTDDHDEDDSAWITSHEESDDDDNRESGIIENNDDPDEQDDFDDSDDIDDDDDLDDVDDHDDKDDDDHDDTDDHDEDDSAWITSHEESDDDDNRESGIIENNDDPGEQDDFDDSDDIDDENDSYEFDDDDEPDDD